LIFGGYSYGVTERSERTAEELRDRKARGESIREYVRGQLHKFGAGVEKEETVANRQ